MKCKDSFLETVSGEHMAKPNCVESNEYRLAFRVALIILSDENKYQNQVFST